MPEIIPNQDFKHGPETYEKGEKYEVSAEEAYYFKMCGWVGALTSNASDVTVTLDIHDSQMGHKSEVK